MLGHAERDMGRKSGKSGRTTLGVGPLTDILLQFAGELIRVLDVTRQCIEENTTAKTDWSDWESEELRRFCLEQLVDSAQDDSEGVEDIEILAFQPLFSVSCGPVSS